MPRFLLALILTALASVAIGLLTPPLPDLYAYPLHSWTWWTVQHVVKNPRWARSDEHKIALLGSSLMVVAMAESDATWLGRRLDLTTYREANCFDARINEKLIAQADKALPETSLGGPISGKGPAAYLKQERVRTINLSAPGQIPSDAYLTLKFMLAQETDQAADLIVYGIAPRDLFDGTLSDPCDTECYRYLSRFVSTSELDSVLNQPTWNKFIRTICSANPMLNRSIDLQLLTKTCLSKPVELFLDDHSCKEISLTDRMLLLKQYQPLDMDPGFIHAEVARRDLIESQYLDNLQDYAARYRRPKRQFYQSQLQSLVKIAELCRVYGIKLCLINMPVQKENIALLSRGLHAEYLADLRALSRRFDVPMYDFCDFNRYSRYDYRDSVHLNGFGGLKFIDQLTEALIREKVYLQW